MRTPEHRAQPRVGKKFETELDMHYLSPGAFTVLPLDVNRLPDPPPAPPPYRLPTTTRRFKHPSFAIIGEAASSSPNSRSSSPTGRVSPFRGRGFNAAGSRHVSPSTSPIPPEDPRTRSPSPTKTALSKIPKPRKSSTAAVFGEKVNHVEFQGLSRQGSQSLSSLEERQTRRKPPPSPRKKLKGAAAFKQLSPIQGSSPEPSQSQSSPSRIPTKSQSTPPSRYASPTREPKVKRSRSRPSVVKSRDPSPLASPTKIPVNRYQHVQSKINTFNKPKLPAKPQLSSDVSEDSGSPQKKVQSRKNSFNRTSSRPNLLPKTYMGKHTNYTSDSSDAVDVKTPPVKPPAAKPPAAKPAAAKAAAAAANKVLPAPNASSSPTKSKAPPRAAKGHIAQKVNDTPAKAGTNRRPSKSSTDETSSPEEGKKPPPLSDLEDDDDSAPSALGVVSSTTNTVATPLKIETPKLGRSKPMSPMIDGRVLSATSVSHAINKMNDTVLNTQTLIKDSGLQSRLPPAASAIIALKSDSGAKDLATSALENSEKTTANSRPDVTRVDTHQIHSTTTTTTNEDEIAKTTSNSAPPAKIADYPQTTPSINNNNNHSNHVTTIGLGNAKAIEREVQNNMNRLLGSMGSSLDGVPASKMSVNDRIREARTVIAADVKPIRITVREKPSDVDVQSGNVGPHFGIANGVNERPSLPPSQQQPPQPEGDASAKEELPPNRCKRFLSSCTKALTCGSCLTLGCKACQRSKNTSKNEETEAAQGCFKSLTNKLTKEAKEQVRINIEDENGQTESKTLWQKISCRQNKVGDSSGCFPKFGKSKERVSVRTTSFLESEVQGRTKCCSKEGCRSFFRKIFCSGCCKKNEEPQPVGARKESMVSSKKKSLTPTSVPPPEESKPKIDASLVEHTSHMKGAIPVLPIWLAWFCCIMNCIGPGTGTILSGMFCLCIGKPRFSQKDGPKPRIGAFIIDLIIGFSQFFTVLFCLVGWGWSIWWGVIMVKIARKHKKIKHMEMLEDAAGKPQPLAGHQKRDVERHRP